MALKAVLLLLSGLALSVHCETSFCNVTCSTDFDVMVNCSCSASLQTDVLVTVICSDDSGLEANGSCQITPTQSWCVMYPDNMDDVTFVGTMCTAMVTQQGGDVQMNESSVWELSHVVKTLPPFDVQMTDSDGFYNITWEHDNGDNLLTYRVRIRESSDLSKDPALLSTAKAKHFLFKHMKLQPHVTYTVDVGAKMDPDNLYLGPWSEWSSSTEWRTVGSSEEIKGFNKMWCFALLVFLAVFGFFIYIQKTYLQKKLHLITYIPTPDEFFKPLYHNYGGNFKEWGKPAFSEYDYLKINAHVQKKSEKEPDDFEWKNEKQSFREDSEIKQAGHFLHMLQPHSNSLPFLQDGGSSQSAGHSSGHVSIHTVTLSGEEEFEEEVRSRSSVNTLRSYRDGESFGSFGDDNIEHPHYDLEEHRISGLHGQSGMLPQRDNQLSNDLSVGSVNFEPHAQINEAERVSLDSFVSHEQSEDGYPHVDLDTIDSGFGECSSPGASDSSIAEQMDLFQEHKSSNSNYVKQWMFCSTIPEDSNTDNEIHESHETHESHESL
ncbi:interleukin 21 receptor, tandem duplicate 1 [Notolabrus celidotus]|uniref:interleukin 21 receptor, tandem duplicate 1 n=1 Tax=Notolabrus celidotus TaxID=1203425 RepID=UPI0014907B91|nr:interleukin 21 receptor, tandem duplicate 1 [Notolabrus celidotus]